MRSASHRLSCSVLMDLPAISSATTKSSLPNAASISAPSRNIALPGFSPGRRVATGISCSSRLKGVRSRFWYSRNPLFTQSGRRVPAAINRHFILRTCLFTPVRRGFSGARGALGCRYVPQLFEPVEFPHARQHDVHDHLVQIDENPIAVLLTLDTMRAKPRLLGSFDHAL